MVDMKPGIMVSFKKYSVLGYKTEKHLLVRTLFFLGKKNPLHSLLDINKGFASAKLKGFLDIKEK